MAEQAEKLKKAPPGWGFAFAVFMVLGIGATAMSTISHKQQATADQQRFVEEAQLVNDAVSEEVGTAFVGINQVAHYLGQTLSTSSPEDFASYLEGSEFVTTYPVLRNGILVVELIPDTELDDLVARERRHNPDFEVRPMVQGYDSPVSWVVTRATNEELFGVDLFGADIAQLGLALPGYLPTEEQPLTLLPLTVFGAIAGSADDPNWDNLVTKAASGQFQQIVMRWIPGDDSRPVGLLFASLNDETIASDLQTRLPSQVKVHVQLLTDSALARPVPAAGRSAYARSNEIRVEGTRWQVTVWASEGFASTDLSVTVALMAIGWIFASIISVGLLLRYRGLGELEDVQLELQVTSELAGSDPLTGLINRSEMISHIQDAIDNGDSVAVLFLDMDRFKLVNDTLGHDAGDELLIAVARRISETVRNTDWVARFGGDEFVILLDGVKTITEATATAQAIQARIQRPLELGATSFHPAASIGVAIAGQSMFLSPSELLRQADTAMYSAKRSQQSGIAVFDASMRDAAVDRLALEQDLHEAVSAKQFVCHFQPIVDGDGVEVAFESTLLWNHPNRGLLDTAELQDIARQSGLIGEMTNQAISQACLRIESLTSDQRVHMNVDAHVLGDPDFGNRLQVILTQSGINPARLLLEVTEEGLSGGDGAIEATISYLSNYGIGFAVDNFGKGQTSLSLLTRFQQLSLLKLDKEMVSRVLSADQMSPVVKAIVAVAHSLNIVVAAEGVETEADRQALLGLGVQWTQGPLHGEPALADQDSAGTSV